MTGYEVFFNLRLRTHAQYTHAQYTNAQYTHAQYTHAQYTPCTEQLWLQYKKEKTQALKIIF